MRQQRYFLYDLPMLYVQRRQESDMLYYCCAYYFQSVWTDLQQHEPVFLHIISVSILFYTVCVYLYTSEQQQRYTGLVLYGRYVKAKVQTIDIFIYNGIELEKLLSYTYISIRTQVYTIKEERNFIDEFLMHLFCMVVPIRYLQKPVTAKCVVLKSVVNYCFDQ